MVETLKVTLPGRISGVNISEGIVEGERPSPSEEALAPEEQAPPREQVPAVPAGPPQETTQVPDPEREKLKQLCGALAGAVHKLDQLQADVLEQSEQQLVDLAMAIARKVLMQEVDAGNYDIESIVKEALKRVSPRREVVIRLSPQDHARCEMARQEAEAGSEGRVKFVPDPQVEPAQCLVETVEGTIESSMETQLANVAEVLDLPEQADGDG
jgi:flagellar biosynthesis/type III secretory pathway protein FliH